MPKKIEWGILACGRIAKNFARDLQHSAKNELVAVGSRNKRKAKAFAKDFSDVRAYGSYEALVQDDEVDIVYVASLHPGHMEHTLLAIEAGKHVLCEKPIAINAKQTQTMIKAARKRDVFLMEAMWTRFFPAILRLRKWLDEERIGQILAMQADFGIRVPWDPKGRLFDPVAGGGALLDLGIYPISFASLVMGCQPEKIQTHVNFCSTGVDDQSSFQCLYADGVTANLFCSSRVWSGHELRLYGTEGQIAINGDFFHPDHVILEMRGKKPRTYPYPHPGNGMQFEADHVATCLCKGQRESDILPLDESLAIMKTLDKIRRQWKFMYPGE
ncbi:Gfo/Idh/MocA family protein [Planctomycetota bacterium]